MSRSEMNRRAKKWATLFPQGDQQADVAVRMMAQEAGLSEVAARLLYIRGYRTAEEANRFFRMEATQLHDPYLMRDMSLAVERILRAVRGGEKICVYGDYDVDGVTAVSLLYLYLKELGADIGYYIPSRSLEGYGISNFAIDRLSEDGVRLMITVDTGITANAEAEYAASLGIDMVITDHHECRAELPTACAVVNPHRHDDEYPFKELAGVGVIFKVICAIEMALCREQGIPEINGVRRVCMQYSDLVAIGTIADVMQVSDENRLIISMGLKRMEADCRLGLQELADAASAGKDKSKKNQKKFTSTFIGFVIAPRMNAAGRVSRASIAVELLLSEDRERARELAEELCHLNLKRQEEENRITETAYRKIEELPLEERRFVLVLDDDSWHQGIIGIVSSRITERYGLPSILISYDGSVGETPSGSDVGKGSGRSLKGVNLVNALSTCEDLLVRFGGHELAAGLSIRRKDVEAFRRRINQNAEAQLGGEPICVNLDADCEVQMSELTMRLAQEINYFEPFGSSNPVPCFILRDARILRISPMGGGKHLRMTVEKDGLTINAVWFGTAVSELPFEPSEAVDLLFQLNVNEFQNTTTLQMIIQDAKTAESYERRYEAQVARYCEIKAGAEYEAWEQVLPNREDVAAVYTYLRREFRAGHTCFPIRRLLASVRTPEGGSFNYIKLKFIIRILQELRICGVNEPTPDYFLFDIFYQTKTNLEKSSILHKLRSQQKKPPLF
ncbi:MAG: single-stranded-DNA-specific exonuclease RecJ [Ruminococcaceae bacterium]|nr:single-stranded-DNA-specific exonuclease RecJ [Oscillospiraceae bacterium]